jgi:hypothetical protein
MREFTGNHGNCPAFLTRSNIFTAVGLPCTGTAVLYGWVITLLLGAYLMTSLIIPAHAAETNIGELKVDTYTCRIYDGETFERLGLDKPYLASWGENPVFYLHMSRIHIDRQYICAGRHVRTGIWRLGTDSYFSRPTSGHKCVE